MGEETEVTQQDAMLRSLNVHLAESQKTTPPHWTDCEDLEVYSNTGQMLFAGPRYFRCTRIECHQLVTHGMVAQGGCWCGNRRLGVALRLTVEEKALLKRGYYPLVEWELLAIQPTLPTNQTETGWGHKEVARRYA